jgi:hypothetical protein
MIRVESAMARALVSQGRSEEAVRRLLRVARLTRRWEYGEPLGPLINNAIRCLTIDALNHALRQNTRLPALLHDAVEREIAANESIIGGHLRLLQMNKLDAIDLYDEVNPLTRVPLFEPFANNDRARMLSFFHRLMKAAEKSGLEANADAMEIERELKQTKGHPVERFAYVGTTLLLPATTKIREVFDRTLAQSRCLRVVNAWARRGDFNVPLEKLGLPSNCLVDPYDGKRLRVANATTGPIIYSVGENLIDDGGDFQLLLDVGLGPTLLESDDLKRGNK